ncbi:glutamate-1-semialdehyde 2,1-aminomutase, partial [mine drainage metagenome]
MIEPTAGPCSRALFRQAQRVLVGGVDSPVRSFAQVGGTPPFIVRGEGPWIFDADGRRYLDLVNSWGANLMGHAPPPVVAAVRAAAGDGLSFGAPTQREHRLAERIRREIPTMERMRFVTSGTEAVMSAIRVARGSTGRSRIVKFAGGY